MVIIFNLLGGIVGTLITVAMIILYDVLKQMYIFNGGICRKTKQPWLYDYTNHEGTRVYYSTDNNVCMIYNKIIDKKWQKFHEL